MHGQGGSLSHGRARMMSRIRVSEFKLEVRVQGSSNQLELTRFSDTGPGGVSVSGRLRWQ